MRASPTHLLVKSIAQKITRLLTAKKVAAIIWYGSSCHSDRYNDIDLYIILKKHTFATIERLRPILRYYKARGITLSLFVDGEDRILQRGVNNFQFGRHGPYFIDILAHGYTLFGSNPCQSWRKQIRPLIRRRSLEYRIAEYFYRIEKIIKEIPRTAACYATARKYLIRIVVDLALLDKKVSFADVAVSSHKKLVQALLKSDYPRLSSKSRSWLRVVLSGRVAWKKVTPLLDALFKDYCSLRRDD